MAQSRATKHFHTFVGGLNTEVSPLVFPDNTSVDLSNMELNIDGSLSRRKGLGEEPSSSRLPVNEDIGFDFSFAACSTHFWRNVNGTDENFQVAQIGHELYFWTDDDTSFAANERGFSVDLQDHIIPNSGWTVQDVANELVDFSWGRGQALVTHKMLEPFFLTYDPIVDSVISTPIQVRVRDFVGIQNGIQNTTLPGTISAAHRYNLRNRGWTEAEILDFNSTQGEYPSYNMRPGFARRRENIAGFNTEDGTYTIHTERVAGKRFGNGSAPTGKFFANPFADAVVSADEDADDNPITTWNATTPPFAPGVNEITITTEVAHGKVATDFIIIEGQRSDMITTGKRRGGTFQRPRKYSFNGAYECKAGTTGSTIIIDIVIPPRWDSFTDREEILGVVQSTLTNAEGADSTVRPTTNAYFAGRAWYAGTPAGVLGQHVLFSQIIQKNEQYGRCYQEADPTDDDNPDIVESDGGLIFIPEAGRILKLQPFGPSMLVFSDNGIWEIDGGGNRYFDALDFSVRRVSGVGCISRESVIEAEDNIIYASEQGPYRVFVDPEARVLVTENIGQTKIQSEWAAIPTTHKEAMTTVFDPVKKRLLFNYDTNTQTLITNPTRRTWVFRRSLIYDARLDAWYKYDYNSDDNEDHLIKGFALPERYNADGEAKIKVMAYDKFGTDQGMSWYEFNDDVNFQDWDFSDAPAYVVTGHEHMQDVSKDKQVRYITTFMERIENASLSMRGRWDFADAEISGKWSPSVEAYRPPRLWLGAHGADGYPVVVSRHTLPGQGQSLSIRYDSNPGADAVLYGWTIDFQGIVDG